MAKYPKEVDRALGEFCREFGLNVVTVDREVEVRSIDVVDDQANSYQIWLERSESVWTVKLWDRESRSAEFAGEVDNLVDILRSTYRKLESWMADDGHTRTWVA